MNYYSALILVLLGYMSIWFIISLLRQRNDVADARTLGRSAGEYLGIALGLAYSRSEQG